MALSTGCESFPNISPTIVSTCHHSHGGAAWKQFWVIFGEGFGGGGDDRMRSVEAELDSASKYNTSKVMADQDQVITLGIQTRWEKSSEL